MTGVQTCALPISLAHAAHLVVDGPVANADVAFVGAQVGDGDAAEVEIGRASCRERV